MPGPGASVKQSTSAMRPKGRAGSSPMAFDKSAPLEPAKAGLTRNALGVAEELGEIGRVRQNHYLRLVAHSATHGIQTLLDPGEKAGTASTRQTDNFLPIG